jgi:hypothetical protein
MSVIGILPVVPSDRFIDLHFDIQKFYRVPCKVLSIKQSPPTRNRYFFRLIY